MKTLAQTLAAGKIVLASGNRGKLAELRELLGPLGLHLETAADLGLPSPEETGLTFVENALIKARHAAKATGMPSLADDSGLTVTALSGEPGVYSARYAGVDASDEDNVRKLLRELEHLAPALRGASFHACVVFLRHACDPAPIICHGVWHGRILDTPAGDGGFGYDPVFAAPEYADRAAAELTAEQKNQVSHRGKALRALIGELQQSAS
jgi:XTP/dITP diphosphohydrolase